MQQRLIRILELLHVGKQLQIKQVVVKIIASIMEQQDALNGKAVAITMRLGVAPSGKDAVTIMTLGDADNGQDAISGKQQAVDSGVGIVPQFV